MSALCYNCGWWTDINGVCICGYSGRPTIRNDSCAAWKPQNEIVTNADRIRAMSDEELAEFLTRWDCCGSTEGLGYNTDKIGNDFLCTAPGGGDINGECKVCTMAWLKQEAT